MSKNKKNTRRVTVLAMMIAVSVVIGIICKNLFTVAVYYRFTLENLSVIFAGVFFGPAAGAVVALAADTISCLLSTNPVINPIISLGSVAVGFVSGAVSRYVFRNRRDTAAIAVSAVSAHIIGQVIIKSIGKIVYYGMPWYGIFIGLVLSAVAVTVEILAIRAIYNNPQIHKFINGN